MRILLRAQFWHATKRILPLPRLFWLGMVLLHVPGLIALAPVLLLDPRGSGPLTGVRFVGLVISAVFFLLKIIDVSWLRMTSGWRSTAAVLVILGLVHVGVVERAVVGGLDCSPAHLSVVLCIGTAWQADRLKLALALIFTLLRVLDEATMPLAPRGGLWRRTGQFDGPTLALCFVPACTGPRAPPLR